MERLSARLHDSVLIIEETAEGVYLYTFPKVGFAGDTWHKNVHEAKEQAGPGVIWTPIAPSVFDLRAYAREISN